MTSTAFSSTQSIAQAPGNRRTRLFQALVITCGVQNPCTFTMYSILPYHFRKGVLLLYDEGPMIKLGLTEMGTCTELSHHERSSKCSMFGRVSAGHTVRISAHGLDLGLEALSSLHADSKPTLDHDLCASANGDLETTHESSRQAAGSL